MTEQEMKKINDILAQGYVTGEDYILYKKYLQEKIDKAKEQLNEIELEKKVDSKRISSSPQDKVIFKED